MVEPEVKPSSSGNVVEGFSERLNFLMDRSRFPRENRVSVGARRFSVVHNTFKAWCASDRIPGTHSALIGLVEELLKDVPSRYNPRAVAAWLLAGDAVPNPFGDDTDALASVELYLEISEVAQREGIDFDKLPRDVRNLILRRVQETLHPDAAHSGGGLKLDNTTLLSIVLGMLETTRSKA